MDWLHPAALGSDLLSVGEREGEREREREREVVAGDENENRCVSVSVSENSSRRRKEAEELEAVGRLSDLRNLLDCPAGVKQLERLLVRDLSLAQHVVEHLASKVPLLRAAAGSVASAVISAGSSDSSSEYVEHDNEEEGGGGGHGRGRGRSRSRSAVSPEKMAKHRKSMIAALKKKKKMQKQQDETISEEGDGGGGGGEERESGEQQPKTVEEELLQLSHAERAELARMQAVIRSKHKRREKRAKAAAEAAKMKYPQFVPEHAYAAARARVRQRIKAEAEKKGQESQHRTRSAQAAEDAAVAVEKKKERVRQGRALAISRATKASKKERLLRYNQPSAAVAPSGALWYRSKRTAKARQVLEAGSNRLFSKLPRYICRHVLSFLSVRDVLACGMIINRRWLLASAEEYDPVAVQKVINAPRRKTLKALKRRQAEEFGEPIPADDDPDVLAAEERMFGVSATHDQGTSTFWQERVHQIQDKEEYLENMVHQLEGHLAPWAERVDELVELITRGFPRASLMELRKYDNPPLIVRKVVAAAVMIVTTTRELAREAGVPPDIDLDEERRMIAGYLEESDIDRLNRRRKMKTRKGKKHLALDTDNISHLFGRYAVDAGQPAGAGAAAASGAASGRRSANGSGDPDANLAFSEDQAVDVMRGTRDVGRLAARRVDQKVRALRKLQPTGWDRAGSPVKLRKPIVAGKTSRGVEVKERKSPEDMDAEAAAAGFPTWPECHAFLFQNNCLAACKRLQRDQIDTRLLSDLGPLTDYPQFNETSAAKFSQAVASVCRWVLAVVEYGTIQNEAGGGVRYRSALLEWRMAAAEELRDVQLHFRLMEMSPSARAAWEHRRQLALRRQRGVSPPRYHPDGGSMRRERPKSRDDNHRRHSRRPGSRFASRSSPDPLSKRPSPKKFLKKRSRVDTKLVKGFPGYSPEIVKQKVVGARDNNHKASPARSPNKHPSRRRLAAHLHDSSSPGGIQNQFFQDDVETGPDYPTAASAQVVQAIAQIVEDEDQESIELDLVNSGVTTGKDDQIVEPASEELLDLGDSGVQAAAGTIQRAWRRKNQQRRGGPAAPAPEPTSEDMPDLEDSDVQAAAGTIQRAWRRKNQQRQSPASAAAHSTPEDMPDLEDSDVQAAAGTIQRAWRRKNQQRRSPTGSATESVPEEIPDLGDSDVQAAAGTIQRAWRRKNQRRKSPMAAVAELAPEEMPDLQDPDVQAAAGTIQQAFRRKQSRRLQSSGSRTTGAASKPAGRTRKGTLDEPSEWAIERWMHFVAALEQTVITRNAILESVQSDSEAESTSSAVGSAKSPAQSDGGGRRLGGGGGDDLEDEFDIEDEYDTWIVRKWEIFTVKLAALVHQRYRRDRRQAIIERWATFCSRLVARINVDVPDFDSESELA